MNNDFNMCIHVGSTLLSIYITVEVYVNKVLSEIGLFSCTFRKNSARKQIAANCHVM